MSLETPLRLGAALRVYRSQKAKKIMIRYLVPLLIFTCGAVAGGFVDWVRFRPFMACPNPLTLKRQKMLAMSTYEPGKIYGCFLVDQKLYTEAAKKSAAAEQDGPL